MKIVKVKYLENGYFEVKYSGFDPVIQDIGAIKMQSPADDHVKDILLFVRRIKLEKIEQKDDFDEIKYRNCELFEDNSWEQQLQKMKGFAAAQSVPPPLPKSKYGSDIDLDELLNKL